MVSNIVPTTSPCPAPVSPSPRLCWEALIGPTEGGLVLTAELVLRPIGPIGDQQLLALETLSSCHILPVLGCARALGPRKAGIFDEKETNAVWWVYSIGSSSRELVSLVL